MYVQHLFFPSNIIHERVIFADNLVQCLSAQRGCRGLFRRDQGLAELDLSSLYGIHVFAFVFIVLGHRFGAYMITTIINYEDIEYVSMHMPAKRL